MNTLIEAVVGFDQDKSKKAAEEALKAGVPAYDVIMEGLALAMEEVGRRYEAGEYFLSELVMAGISANAIVDVVVPRLQIEKKEKVGIVLVGTVEGDLHDIGKNLVVTLLKASGFDVHDLGNDVPPKRFVEMVKEKKPNVVGLSSLLTSTLPKIRETLEALKEAGVRETVKVIVGGRAMTQEMADEYGADAYAEDAVKGLKIVKSWSGI